jgi:hypothetical protein
MYHERQYSTALKMRRGICGHMTQQPTPPYRKSGKQTRHGYNWVKIVMLGGGEGLCDHVTQHSSPPYGEVWLNRPDLDRIGLKL